jgi:uncharacterized protein YcfJ
MKKDILNKMSAETLSQMAANGDISDNFSKGLKNNFLKLGSTAVLAGLLAMSGGVAHAENGTRNTTLTLAGLFGVATNGSKPADTYVDCNVQGTSGMKVGAGGILGAIVGRQIGSGNGREVATVAGGILGAASAQASENDRIRRDCGRQIQQSQRNGTGIPVYATNNASPQSPILYEGRTIQGRSFYVTQASSPGIGGLQGRIVGQLNVEDDPLVRSAMEKCSVQLPMAYDQLDISSQKYTQVMSGGTTVARLSRYAVDDNDVAPNSRLNQDNQMRLNQAKRDFDDAYSEYSRKRSVCASVSDNAVVDGYDISRYGRLLNYFTPPESATITYSGKLQNRYAVIPNPVRP